MVLENTKQSEKELKKSKFFVVLLWVTITSASLFATIWIVIDTTRPYCYNSLFLLPLTYGILSFFSLKLYNNMSQNLGMAIIIILFFVRMVLSPLFMRFGRYHSTITLNVEKNTFYAILLVAYEAIAVFSTLHYKMKKNKNQIQISEEEHIFKIGAVYKFLIFAALILFLLCLRATPQIMDMYRTIFEITEEHFSNYEDAYVISKYAVSFISKLSLVTGMYLSRALILLLPAFLIVQLSTKKSFFRKLLALLLCIVPLFFISGTIAKSLIYVICLLFLYNYMFAPKKAKKRTIILLALGAVSVVAWWLFRSGDNNLAESFSWRSSSYFSGVNIVSGVFNLPRTLDYRIRFFLYDFTSTFPYGNTIFQLSGDTIQPFFNDYNYSMGQIPPTIGMGYYYFGAIFAPIYSIIFTKIAFDAGVSLNKNLNQNPMSCIRYLITAFYFSMGIVMYNIEITMIYYFTLILPMYLLEKTTYTRSEKGDT